jgi:thymidylate synthase (FAD)
MTDNVLGDNIGFVRLVSSMGDDLNIVNAARVSYGKSSEEFGDKDRRLVTYLLKNSHTSPLEHVMFTFNVKVPLFIERQWQRHRTWAFFSLNEVSRRYTSENIEFYIPDKFRIQSTDNKQMSTDELLNEHYTAVIKQTIREQCESALEVYNLMLHVGVAREIARGILPQFMYTNFYASVDLHNLLWFLELRRHPHSQKEIQLYAESIERIIEKIVPNTYSIWSSLMEEKYK